MLLPPPQNLRLDHMILAPKAGLNRGYWWFLLRFWARPVVLPTLPIDKPLVRRRFGHIGPQGPSSFKVCVPI